MKMDTEWKRELIIGETDMVALSLQSNTPEQKSQARHIVEDLRNNYGEDNVYSCFSYDFFVYVEIRKVSGYIQGKNETFKHDAKVHLFDSETQRINYDIPFEIIDTIYNLWPKKNTNKFAKW